ncbi:MerR family transcriptional regulator [Deinococcus rubellus]|uniref:MerR family transcriptional regulator n=1 Tax=Deinococcus rubellus TaxID=1889240 RepID=A0ABY5YIJ4_9DEIO|nr:MerR family transcriptional regulator [Deinococcus rubellus]UWX64922.1 MerR family transcriptional regulator [Deinococcus rubellus]
MPSATLTPSVQGPMLSIGEVAARLGVSVHTLRYYERAGLLDVPRQESGVRRYSGREVELLRFLLALRATGMPIALIRRYIGLARLGEVSETERRALLVQHREDVLARMRALKTDLGAIERKIELYDQNHKEPR